MFRTDSGGPAFPRTGFYPDTASTHDIEHVREMIPTVTEPQSGMTLFDFYVGQAIQGILANPNTQGEGPTHDWDKVQEHIDSVAGSAVLYAHALLLAREKYLALPKPPKVYNPEDEG